MSGFFDDASWVLIPEGIKEDVVYAQKPTSGLGDLSFTRASDATRTNSAGVIERTPWNLATFSEVFSDASWVKVAATIGVNTVTAPNGTLTADSLIENTATSLHLAYQGFTSVSGVTYTASFYVSPATRNTCYVRADTSAGTTRAFFTLTGNGSTTSPNATITRDANGFYRCTFRFTEVTGGSRLFAIEAADGTSVNYLGNGQTALYVWGAQLVEGTDAKPYFATTNRQDVPRLDYRNADGSVSTCPRLLLEPQRTNLVPNGVLFNSITGVSYDSSITASPAPGVQNATRITKNEAAGNVRYANQNASATLLAGSSVYTLSRYFKYDGFDFQTTMEYNNAGNWGGVSWTVPINISSTSITIGTPTACTATIVNMGSGWYRVTATITTGAIPVGFPTYLMRLPSTLSTGQGFLTALPQLELGAYATTFIPTTTAAVTRLADSASKTGVSSLIGQTSGTLFVEWDNSDKGLINLLETYNNASTITGTSSIIIQKTGTANQINIRVFDSLGSYSDNFTATMPNGTNKLALAYQPGSAVYYLNGSFVGGNTRTYVFGSTRDTVGFDNRAPYPRAQAALFPTRLTNAQLAQLTTL